MIMLPGIIHDKKPKSGHRLNPPSLLLAGAEDQK